MAAAETIQTASTSSSQSAGAPQRYAHALLGIADDLRATEPGAVDRIAQDPTANAVVRNAASTVCTSR